MVNLNQKHIILNNKNEQLKEELAHFGIMGMEWGKRRFQKPDGSLTPAGRDRMRKAVAKIRAAEVDKPEKPSEAKSAEKSSESKPVEKSSETKTTVTSENNKSEPAVDKKIGGASSKDKEKTPLEKFREEHKTYHTGSPYAGGKKPESIKEKAEREQKEKYAEAKKDILSQASSVSTEKQIEMWDKLRGDFKDNKDMMAEIAGKIESLKNKLEKEKAAEEKKAEEMKKKAAEEEKKKTESMKHVDNFDMDKIEKILNLKINEIIK